MKYFGLASMGISALAHGQAINIDFGSATSLPSTGYGAASGQAGVWFSDVSSQAVDTAGNPISFSIVNFGMGGGATDFAGGTVDERRLLIDYLFATDTTTPVGFAGLQPGKYVAFVYMWNHVTKPGRNNKVGFDITNGREQATLITEYTPDWPGTQVEGITYTKWSFDIQAGDFVTLFPKVKSNELAFLQGIQFVPVPSPSDAAMGLISFAWVGRRRLRNV